MLDRNKRIKPRPERFQNCKDLFDLILTCEERVYDQVVEGEPCVIAWKGQGREGFGAGGCRPWHSKAMPSPLGSGSVPCGT